MTDQYYGFTPYSMPSEFAQYDDYMASAGIVNYDPTPWDDFNVTNIDSLWSWIQLESDERATALADMWRRVYTLLSTTSTNLRRYGDALSQKWNSPAS
jgi:hypothetical protein